MEDHVGRPAAAFPRRRGGEVGRREFDLAGKSRGLFRRDHVGQRQPFDRLPLRPPSLTSRAVSLRPIMPAAPVIRICIHALLWSVGRLEAVDPAQNGNNIIQIPATERTRARRSGRTEPRRAKPRPHRIRIRRAYSMCRRTDSSRADAAAFFVRRFDLHQRKADHDAQRVRRAEDRERQQRQRKRGRHSEDKRREAEDPTAANILGPMCRSIGWGQTIDMVNAPTAAPSAADRARPARPPGCRWRKPATARSPRREGPRTDQA